MLIIELYFGIFEIDECRRIGTVIGKQGEPMEIPCKPKIEVAADIVDIIGRYVSEDR